MSSSRTIQIDRDAFEDIMRTMRELKVCLDNKIAENRKIDSLHKLEIRSLTNQLDLVRSETFNSRGDSERKNCQLIQENKALQKELQQLKTDRHLNSNHDRLAILLKTQIEQLRATNQDLQTDLKKTQDIYWTQSKEIETLNQLKSNQKERQKGQEKCLQETNSQLEICNRELEERLREKDHQLRTLEQTRSEYECLKLKSVQWEQDATDLRSTLTAVKSEAEVLQKEREDLVKHTEQTKAETETLSSECQKIASEKAALQEENDRLFAKVQALKDIKNDVDRLRQLSDSQTAQLHELRKEKADYSTVIQSQEMIVKSVESEKERLAKKVKSLKKSVSKLETTAAAECQNLNTDNEKLKMEVAQLHALIDRQQLILRKDQHTFFDEEDSTLSLSQHPPDPDEVAAGSGSDNSGYVTPADTSDADYEEPEEPAIDCKPISSKLSAEKDSWFAVLEKQQRNLLCGKTTVESESVDSIESEDSLLAQKCINYLQKRKSQAQRDTETGQQPARLSLKFAPQATRTPHHDEHRRPKPVRKKTLTEDTPPSAKTVENLRNTYTPALKVAQKSPTTGVSGRSRPEPSADPPVVRPRRPRDNR